MSKSKTFSEEADFHAVTFRHRLVAMRRAKGYSQQSLADLIGCHYRTIAEYENGRAEPTLTKLLHLCKALRCMPNQLLLSA